MNALAHGATVLHDNDLEVFLVSAGAAVVLLVLAGLIYVARRSRGWNRAR